MAIIRQSRAPAALATTCDRPPPPPPPQQLVATTFPTGLHLYACAIAWQRADRKWQKCLEWLGFIRASDRYIG